MIYNYMRDEYVNKFDIILHLQRLIQSSSYDGDYNQGFVDGIDFVKGFIETLDSIQSSSDCIDREVTKEHIYASETNGRPLHRLELNELISEIDEIPHCLPNMQWISCRKKLPIYGQKVLTYDGNICWVEARIPYVLDKDGNEIEGDWWVSDDVDHEERLQ